MKQLTNKIISMFLLSFASTAFTMQSNENVQCIVLDKEVCDLICASERFLRDNNMEPSQALIACCSQLSNGCCEVSITQLYEALPELAKCVLLSGARAPRPGDWVVGSNYSNQDQIIGLINQILCRLQDCGDINNTFSDCCQEILITLTEINTTLTSCCNDIVETLTVDIVNSLTEIITTLTECCSTIETLSLVFTSSCQATPIFDAITITVPGIYCLNNSIEGTLVIAADDVDVNLNNYRISGATNGIVVNPGFARIAIHDGQIGDTTDQAILVSDGASQITIENIEIDGAGNATIPWAIEFQGTGATRISEGLIRNVRISDSAAGIYLQNADHIQIIDSKIVDCVNTGTATGIFIFGDVGTPATCNEVINCQVCNCSATSLPIGGILAYNTLHTVLDNCRVSEINGSNLVFGISASFSPASLITNCLVSDLTNVTTVLAQTQGIWIFNSPTSVVRNSSTINIGSNVPSGFALGLNVEASPASIIDTVFVSAVSSSTVASGIVVDISSPNSVVQGCVVSEISGSFEGAGIEIFGDNVTCRNCDVADVTGDIASAFDIDKNGALVNSALVWNCNCADVVALLNARGFYINGSNSYIGDCSAVNIAGDQVGGDGYQISSLSTLVLVESCIITNASRNGFRAGGSNSQIQLCTAKNCGAEGILADTTAADSVIDSCHATNCDIGISDLSGTSTMTNCYAALNTTQNYNPINPTLNLAPGSVPVVGVNIDA